MAENPAEPEPGPPPGDRSEQLTMRTDLANPGPVTVGTGIPVIGSSETEPGTGSGGHAAVARGKGLPPPAAGGSEAPLVVAGYRRLRLIGQGGMGQVWLAEHQQLKRQVALKLLKPSVVEDPDFVQRFLRESQAMAQVSHANVVAIHDAGSFGGYLYMALEYVPGGDLHKVMRYRGTIDERTALGWISACASGLEAIHTARLLHRDIKPANIFLDRSNNPKIGDLGLARRADGEDRFTMTGVAWGTPAYMAPEAIRGLADVDIRADIYALGATLFTLLTGREPFLGPTSFVVTHQVLSDPAPDPRAFNPAVSPAAAGIVAKALAKDRAQRYLLPADLRLDCERALAQMTLAHARAAEPVAPAPPPQRPIAVRAARPPRIDPRALRLLLFLLVGGGLTAVVWSMQGGTSIEPRRPPPRPAAGIAAAAGPSWSARSGSDDRGAWCELAVAGTALRLRRLSPCTFTMGSPAVEAGRARHETIHEVRLTRPVWMAETEITQRIYQDVVGINPSVWPGDDRPVESVSWHEAQSFCAKLSSLRPGLQARLPTEAEWECACRAGGRGAFAEGPAIGELGWAGQPRAGGTRRVGSARANAWGLFDMHGNVREWCADNWDGQLPLADTPATDPLGTIGALAVVRSGAYDQPEPAARSAAREGLDPQTREPDLGFRVVVEDAAR